MALLFLTFLLSDFCKIVISTGGVVWDSPAVFELFRDQSAALQQLEWDPDRRRSCRCRRRRRLMVKDL